MPKLPELLGDLDGQLARGRQDQCLRNFACDVDPLHQRDAIGGGLARAGQRLRHDVAALEEAWDHARLHWCRRIEAHGVETSEYLGSESECLE